MEEQRKRLDRMDRFDTHLSIENFRETDELRARLKRLTALVAVLLLALAALGAYGYWKFDQHGLRLGRLPGLEQTVGAIQERLRATEEQLAQWSTEWNRREERLSAMETRANRNLHQAQKHAQELTAQLHQRMQAELDERTQALEARVENLEIDREMERARVEQVEGQVAALRADTRRDLTTLSETIGRNERGLAELARKYDRQRVDFELSEDVTREVAPGISLRVTSTNVAYQRVRGWLWLLPDRRTLWVRDLQAQQALVFHVRGSEAPHELVITHITRDGVAGYLLIPKSEATPAGAPASD